MNKNKERAKRFLGGFTATVFGGMGWLGVMLTAPSPVFFLLYIPIILFIAVICSLMLESWIRMVEFENEDIERDTGL